MIEKLSTTELFAGLDIATLADLSIFSIDISLQPGDVLMSENDRYSNAFYLLCSGEVEVLSNQSGITSGEVVLSKKDNELFGEMSWLQRGGPRTATVRCVTDVEAIQIDGERFDRYLESNPLAGFIIMRRVANVLARRMHYTDVLLKQLLWNS